MWWLTFYLTATPVRLDALGLELAKLNAVNLEGSESAFLYPKLPIQNSTSAICAAIGKVKDMAAHHGVDVIAVDADTSSDVTASKFAELVRYDGSGS